MIGLIKLTGVDDTPYYINPMGITLFTPATPEFISCIGANPRACRPNCSAILIGSLPLQVRESPQEIVNALTALRRKQESNLLELKKRADNTGEDWQGDGEEEAYGE